MFANFTFGEVDRQGSKTRRNYFFKPVFPPLPVGIVGHCMVRLKDNTFMVIGGFQETGITVLQIEK
jgi:hypothetical protein